MWGEVWRSVLGCGERYKGRCGEMLEKYFERSGKVCWGVGKVRENVGRGVGKCVGVWEEVLGEVWGVWGSVLEYGKDKVR